KRRLSGRLLLGSEVLDRPCLLPSVLLIHLGRPLVRPVELASLLAEIAVRTSFQTLLSLFLLHLFQRQYLEFLLNQGQEDLDSLLLHHFLRHLRQFHSHCRTQRARKWLS